MANLLESLKSFKPITKTTVIASSLVLLLLITVTINLPVRLFLEDSMESFTYTDLKGATFLSGDVWLNLEDIYGPVHLVYNWCPGLSPFSWCVDLQHTAFVLDGTVALGVAGSVSGSKNIGVSNMNIQSVDMALLGLASGFVDARLNGRIDSMEIQLSDCPMKEISQIDGLLGTEDIRILGVSAGAHQLSLNSRETLIEAGLSGDTFTGTIELENGKYSAQGEMNAPESMVTMARSLMSSLGGNRFGWEISGDLPC